MDEATAHAMQYLALTDAMDYTAGPCLLSPEEYAAALRKDAERYRKLRARVRGERHLGTGHNQGFAFPSRFELQPLADIMRGSVSQHLDAAIDSLPAVDPPRDLPRHGFTTIGAIDML